MLEWYRCKKLYKPPLDTRKLKKIFQQMEEHRKDPLACEFGWSSQSMVFIKKGDYYNNIAVASQSIVRDEFGSVILVCQRRQSIDIPIKMVYVKRGRIRNAGNKVIATPAVSGNIVVRSAARQLTPEEFRTRALKHVSETGKYDKELFYDLGQLVSFIDSNNYDKPSELYDREVKYYTARITIPSDFPDDLLDKHITMFLKANVITKGIGSEVDYFTLLVTEERK